MLLEELSKEQQTELKSLIAKYPKEYKKLQKELFKDARYYPSHKVYGIGSYWAKDTHQLGQHWFYDNLIDYDGKIRLNNLLDKI